MSFLHSLFRIFTFSCVQMEKCITIARCKRELFFKNFQTENFQFLTFCNGMHTPLKSFDHRLILSFKTIINLQIKKLI